MRRYLFLDDNPDRHIAFDSIAIGCDIRHVWTVEECISALSSDDPYDCVFLDHDLGGKAFVIEESGTGSEVANFIGQSLDRKKYPDRIIVHSWNPAGAKRMIGYIGPTGIPVKYVPFQFPA